MGAVVGAVGAGCSVATSMGMACTERRRAPRRRGVGGFGHFGGPAVYKYWAIAAEDRAGSVAQ